MITAKDIMTTELTVLDPHMAFCAAARVLLENHFNGAPVVDTAGRLVGVLCQSDLVAQQKKMPVPTLITLLDSFIRLTPTKQLEKEAGKIAALTVGDAMTVEPVTVNPDTTIDTIAALMVDRNFHTLPVLNDGQLVGIIGKEDVLRTLLPEQDDNTS
jgi:CBS domain-containing protein